MEKITSLAHKLKSSVSDHPNLSHLTLHQGEMFGWDHTACAITYNPSALHAAEYLLHEFSHALLAHQSYEHDIDLLKLERAAWEYAKKLAPSYGIKISDQVVETALDTYRDWLHSRSLCPNCGATGVQSDTHVYRCLACHITWRVNEARNCGLRRYPIKKRP